MFTMQWGAKVSPEFRAKVADICRNFDWTNEHASWLMTCMAFETGGTFSPSVKNGAGSSGTGLIQFMAATAVGLGTTVDQLAKLTAVEQLDYVAKYFKPYYKRIKTLSDMYMAILMPKYVGTPESSAVFVSGTLAYTQNKGLDRDGDGVVTKAEVSETIRRKFAEGARFQADCEDV